MRSELNQLLRERYPEIFARPCEISCDDGWFNILDALCGCIQNHVNWRARVHADAVRYNTMADALAGGNDALFLDYFQRMNPDFVSTCREEILAGKRRDMPQPCDQVVASQIKEKFGTLRFYVDGGDEATGGMIQMAETMSAATCEQCGAPGHTGGRGWVRTLCAAHHAQREHQ